MSEPTFSKDEAQPVIHERCILEPMITEHAFSPEDCARILEQFTPDQWNVGTVFSTTDSVEPSEVLEARHGKNYLLEHTPETRWLFQRLLALTLAANKQIYQFDVSHFDAVQLAKYEEGDFYDWHTDIGPALSGNRKLSMTVQLSAEEDYDGGDLVLDFSRENYHASRKLGSATVFPSFMKHKVEPVTKGTRYSIVVWVSGLNRFK